MVKQNAVAVNMTHPISLSVKCMCHKITRKLTVCNVKAKTSVRASFEYIYLKGVNVCVKTTQLSRLLAIFARMQF